MNPLFDVRQGSLYNLDTTPLSDVGYQRESVTTAIFNFYEQPDITFPLMVFFQPKGERYNHTSFIYTLTEFKKGIDDRGNSCYIVTGTTEDVPELRDELRINVSFPIDIQLEDGKTVKATLADLSAGGFMFISENTFTRDTSISFILSSMQTPAYITGVVKRQRPTRSANLKGYGCQFTNLSPATESAIRNFVFHEELIQKRKMKE